MLATPPLVDSDRKIIEKLFSASLLLIIFFLPLNIRLAYLAIAITTALWLLNLKQSVLRFDRAFIGPLCIFTSLFALQIIGLIHTDKLSDGLFQLEKKLSMLLCPLFFFVGSYPKNGSYWIWRFFFAGVLLACIILHVDAFYRIYANHHPLKYFFISSAYQTDQLTLLLELHPTYLSLFIVVILVKFALSFSDCSRKEKMWMLIVSAYFLLFLFQLASRAAIFSCVIVFAFLTIYRATVFRSKRFFILLGSFVLVIGTVLVFVPAFRDRLMDPFVKLQAAVQSNDEENSAILHAKSWHCAIACWKEHPWFGNGTGDERNVLGNCYLEQGWPHMAEIRYDSHNEYLSSLVRHGAVGLIVLLSSFGWSLWTALKNKDQMYAAFLVIIMVAALAESILRGELELIFFAYFNAFLCREMLSAKQEVQLASKKSITT